jgi:hypothetical protein
MTNIVNESLTNLVRMLFRMFHFALRIWMMLNVIMDNRTSRTLLSVLASFIKSSQLGNWVVQCKKEFG